MTLKRIRKRLVEPMIRPFFVDAGGDHRGAVFVAGSERSGTTWLADLINQQGSFRMIFEPFWALRVPACRHFSAQQYLRPEDPAPEYFDTADKVLSGRLRSAWSDKYHRTFYARRRLVKEVRANLMLRWLYLRFPGMPMVLILRHPCAVALSQERAKHRFGDLDAHFLGQSALVEDFLQPHLSTIRGAKTPFEQRIVRWCIQNHVPLSQFKHDEIAVVFYEDLCVRAEETLEKLFCFLEVPLDLSGTSLNRPSPVSRRDSAIVTGESLVEHWRVSISSEQISTAERILREFGLDALYDRATMPHSENLRTLMGR